ncbi:MAG TPA: CRISPR-associated protein Csx14, partial [Methanoregulaceae archaeon]|nr:CRISPR-associated protein Csx14 [Methanoregulaceae archaeon]
TADEAGRDPGPGEPIEVFFRVRVDLSPRRVPWMKTAVLAPIGMSPPVITEFLDAINEPVSDLVLFATEHPHVRAGVRFVQAGLATRYPWLRVHVEVLPFEDIASNDENFAFMSRAARMIRREREVYHCDRVYLNVAGGRKNMCISLCLLGQLMVVDGVFHLVSHNVSWINERLERFRHDIELFADVPDHEARILFEQRKRDYEALLFPDRSTYELIRIPTLPYPSDYLGYLVRGMEEGTAGLTGDDRDMLIQHGLIESIGETLVVTEHGRRFLEVIYGR